MINKRLFVYLTEDDLSQIKSFLSKKYNNNFFSNVSDVVRHSIKMNIQYNEQYVNSIDKEFSYSKLKKCEVLLDENLLLYVEKVSSYENMSKSRTARKMIFSYINSYKRALNGEKVRLFL